MAYRHPPATVTMERPDTATPGLPSKSYAAIDCQSRRSAINRAFVVMMAMLLLTLISGCGKDTTGGDGEAPATIGNSPGKSTISPSEKLRDEEPSQLEQADTYFNQGNYDAALSLYREIGTDYAQRQAYAIECITVSQEVAQEWLAEVDDEIANGVMLAAFGLNFEFDTEYDAETYTFYTKMGYPELYTSLALASGLSQTDIEEGMASSGHEKIAYQLFYDRGYEDITCVSLMLDSEGNVLASYPYGASEYKADLAKAAEEAEAMRKKQEERERLEREFIANLDSNTEFCEAAYKYVKDYVSRDTSTFEADAEMYYNQNVSDGSYGSNFRFIEEVQYGQITGADPEKMAEELAAYRVQNTAFLDYIVFHVPFSAKVAADKGSEDMFFDVVYDFAIVADPEDSEYYISTAPYQAIQVISMEKDDSLTFEQLLDVPCPWPDKETNSSAERHCSWGAIGESVSSAWIKFTVNSVYSASEYGYFKADSDNQLIVASVSLENIHTSPVRFDERSDFNIGWYSGQNWAIAAQFLPINLLGVGEVCSCELVYEVPKEVHNFAIHFADGGLDTTTSMVGFSIGE